MIRFKMNGCDRDGEPLYDLYVDGQLRGHGLSLGDVVLCIASIEAPPIKPVPPE